MRVRSASGGLRGFSVRLTLFFVAFSVEMLDSVPAAVNVNVGNDLATINPGNKFHRVVAVNAGGCAARLYGSNYSPALANGRGIAHVLVVGSSTPRLDRSFDLWPVAITLKVLIIGSETGRLD